MILEAGKADQLPVLILALRFFGSLLIIIKHRDMWRAAKIPFLSGSIFFNLFQLLNAKLALLIECKKQACFLFPLPGRAVLADIEQIPLRWLSEVLL